MPIHVPYTQISRGDEFAVHNYFHVCPESLNGTRVLYSAFPGGPGTDRRAGCEVILCDRDGTNHAVIGRAREAGHHRGARPTWIDDHTVAYHDRWQVHVVDVGTGRESVYRGAVDNYSPALHRIYFTCPGPSPDARGHAQEGLAELQRAVYHIDLAGGQTVPVVEIEDMAPFADQVGEAYDPATWRFAHAYISPQGTRIAFLLRKPHRPYHIFTSGVDGSSLRLAGLKSMHWTFCDETSFFGHDENHIKDHHMRRWDLEGRIVEELSGPGCHGDLSPDGGWIVTEDWYGSDPVNVYLYARGQVQPARVLATTSPSWRYQVHVHPAFSRDGKRVYVNYNGPDSRGGQVYCLDLEAAI